MAALIHFSICVWAQLITTCMWVFAWSSYPWQWSSITNHPRMPTGPYPTYVRLFQNSPPHQRIYYRTPWLLILWRLIVYSHCSFVPSPQLLTHYCAGSGNRDRNRALLANSLPRQQIYLLLTQVRFLLNLKYKGKPKSLLKYQLYFSQIGCHKKKRGRHKRHTQTKGPARDRVHIRAVTMAAAGNTLLHHQLEQ